MSNQWQKSRRSFIKKGDHWCYYYGCTFWAYGAARNCITRWKTEPSEKKFSANDQVNIAVIGMGIMGFSNLATSLQIPGVKLVGVCDLYTGRLRPLPKNFTERNYIPQKIIAKF